MERTVRRPWEPLRVSISFPGESMCEQSHAAAVDINNIVRRFARTGELPPVRQAPIYADVTQLQAPLAERMAFSAATIGAAQEWLEGLPPLDPDPPTTPPPSTAPTPSPAPS